jgi:hypothetical protein
MFRTSHSQFLLRATQLGEPLGQEVINSLSSKVNGGGDPLILQEKFQTLEKNTNGIKKRLSNIMEVTK